ncbi:MAG: polyribonucleotide nucleotidyltransferase, partial [Calditrichia bacterium]|nr:polyribonucleotide nucleotidyltransferase [Calditrichia bacterium]
MIIRKELEFAGNKLIIESGKMAKQASGSVWVQYGDTVVLVAATAASEPREGLDFFPLTVEYREKTYAAGKFPGGFFKRETRPSETEILSARLIDRPIRPLFPNDFQNETQIIVNVISADRENNPDVLGTLGASISLSISDIPFEGPIASVRIGRVDGDYIINPTYAQLEVSDMELVVAGSMDSIMMVEGEAEEVPEETLVEAIKFAHDSIKKLVAFQQEIIDEVKPEKMDVAAKEIPEGLEEKVKELCLPGIAESVKIREKKERNTSLKEVRNKAIEALEEEYTEQTGLIKTIFHDVEKDEVRKMILEENVRLDGRGMDDVRDITCEVGLLPRAHGSALFTRGQTQSLGVVTLGTKSDEQLVETLEGESK